MITIHRIFEIYGLNPLDIRLVRHGNKEIPIYKTFKENLPRLEVYQSFQKPKKFGNAKTIAIFAPYHKTTALFIGLWDIHSCIDQSQYSEGLLQLLKENDLPEEWYHEESVKYDLRQNHTLSELSERLVIEWGHSTVSWVQSKDKDIVEIKNKDFVKGRKYIGSFQSFDRVLINYQDLQKIYQNPDTNRTWVSTLSSVNGIYLINEKTTGKLYVGSAYGEKGIFGRWSDYARNGHGGNKELKGLDPYNFQFSILEILPPTSTNEAVIHREYIWMERLGSRESGYNRN